MKVPIILLSILRPMDAILKKLLLPRGVGGGEGGRRMLLFLCDLRVGSAKSDLRKESNYFFTCESSQILVLSSLT